MFHQSGFYWSEINNAKLTGFADNKKYQELAPAQAACAKNKKCRGLTLDNKIYRLNTVDYLEYSASGTVYIRGGPVADEVTYEVSYKDHVWTVESPVQIEGYLADGRRYRKYTEALKVRKITFLKL